MPYIFVLSWITLYQVLSYLLTEEGLSVKSACILCSVSMKWHRQTLLLTIQLYLQKYRDEIDDQSRPTFKRKPLPAVTSHLALVKFYCDWVPAWHHALYRVCGQRRCPAGSARCPASPLLSLHQQQLEELFRKCTKACWIGNIKMYISGNSH